MKMVLDGPYEGVGGLWLLTGAGSESWGIEKGSASAERCMQREPALAVRVLLQLHSTQYFIKKNNVSDVLEL